MSIRDIALFDVLKERPVHTSPAMFTLERYMQGFRARSQLLVDRYDDEDEVLHQPFPGFDSGQVIDNDTESHRGLRCGQSV